MAVEILPFRDEHRPDIARLLTAFFPDPADGLAVFSWLVDDNPYAGAPMVYLAFAEGKAVAMRVFHAARWELAGAGATFDVPCGVMFVVDPEHRRRGLGNLLIEGATDDLRRRGVERVFSFAAAPVVYRLQESHGWRTVTPYAEVIRAGTGGGWRQALRRPVQLLRQAGRRLHPRAEDTGTAPPGRTRTPFAALDANAPQDFADGRLEVTPTPDAARMARLAENGRDAGLIRHVRGPEYFDWRYRFPARDRRILTWSRGAAQGFLVLEARLDLARPVWVVDWEATDDAVLSHLLSAALAFGRFPKVSLWQAGLSNEVTAFLGRAGFAPVTYNTAIPGYAPGLMVANLTDPAAPSGWETDGTSLLAPEAWALRRAYML